LASDGESITEVRVSLYTRSLSDIVEITRTYKHIFDLDVEWDASEEDMSKTVEEVQSPDWQPTFVPMFIIQNQLEGGWEYVENEHLNSFELRRDRGVCFFRRAYNGTFSCPLSLECFPFDQQVIALVLEMQFRDITRSVFSPPTGTDYIMWINPQFSNLGQWKINRTVAKYYDRSNFSGLLMELHIQRNWKAYFRRTIIMIMALTAVSLLMFYIGPAETADRLAWGVTMILAKVAYQFVLYSTLPDDAKPTILDTYIFLSLSLVMYMCFIAGYVGHRINNGEEDDAKWLDARAFWSCVGAFIAIQVYLFVRVVYALREAPEYFVTEQDYNEPVKLLQSTNTIKKFDGKIGLYRNVMD
jgi:hypothetical protein